MVTCVRFHGMLVAMALFGTRREETGNSAHDRELECGRHSRPPVLRILCRDDLSIRPLELLRRSNLEEIIL